MNYPTDDLGAIRRPGMMNPTRQAPSAPAQRPAVLEGDRLQSSFDRFKSKLKALATPSAKNPNPERRHKELLEALNKRQLRLTDKVLYSVVNASGARTIKFFEAGDRRDVGLQSLDSATMEKNQYMLVDRIKLLGFKYDAPGYVDAGDPGNNVASTDPAANTTITPGSAFERSLMLRCPWYSLSGTSVGLGGNGGQADLAIIANGEVKPFRTLRETFLDNFSLRRFVQDGNYDVETGLLKLDNPYWLNEQDVLEFNLELGRAAATNTLLRLELIGTATVLQ